MNPSILAGLFAGIVLTLATLGVFLLWVTRSHRVDLTGVRIVRAEEWRSDGRPFGAMPLRVADETTRAKDYKGSAFLEWRDQNGDLRQAPWPPGSDDTPGDSDRPPPMVHPDTPASSPERVVIRPFQHGARTEATRDE